MKTLRSLRQFSKEDWKNPLGLALLGYYLVMAVVGLLIPDDILKANAWAREFSDFMASIVPQIDHITALGIKPDVNRFYFSVMWAGSPIFVFVLALNAWRAWKTNQAAIWITPFARALPLMAFIVLMALVSSSPQWLFDPTLRISRFYFGSPLGRAFMAQTFVLCPLFCSFGLLVWIAGWISGYIPRRIKEQKNG